MKDAEEPAPTNREPLSAEETTKAYIEVWKQTVAVQQHFNDIEWRIRQLALTAITFALGAAAVAAKDRTAVNAFGINIQLATLILLFGFALWMSFYFVDQVWYHRLLLGAVKHGEAIEEEIQKFLPSVSLTQTISRSSPYTFGIGSKTICIHSRIKLRIFYVIGGLVLLVAGAALQLSSPAAPAVPPPVP
ncbi:hypothetical protein [Pseudonocardia sp. ICBG1034]|uniref:hypothetical protein n=1 Tax=Pseudonocardia sp. ICBG1034 TaxID=2844381 RepID=UPI001CC98720|nr:hypothetical protein [Pseudonocardia sp. ICBG1034]